MMSSAELEREASSLLIRWDATADRRWSCLGIVVVVAALLMPPLAAGLLPITNTIRLSDVGRSVALVMLPAPLAFQMTVICVVALVGAALGVRTAVAGVVWVLAAVVSALVLAPIYDQAVIEIAIGFYGGFISSGFAVASILRSTFGWQVTGRRLPVQNPRLTILRLFVTTTTAAVLLAILGRRLRYLDASAFGDFLVAFSLGLLLGGLLAVACLALVALVLGRRSLGLLVGLPALGVLLVASYSFASWNATAVEPWTVRVSPGAAMLSETSCVLLGSLAPLLALRLCHWRLQVGQRPRRSG